MRDYHEQLRVPATWWLLAIPVIAVLGAELYAGHGAVGAAVVYGIGTGAVAGFLIAWGLAGVKVGDGVIRVGSATLAIAAVGDVHVLDERQSAQLRGPRADPAAKMLLRPYLKRAVYVEVTDPASEHPYWLIASRRPEELASAIERCRQKVA